MERDRHFCGGELGGQSQETRKNCLASRMELSPGSAVRMGNASECQEKSGIRTREHTSMGPRLVASERQRIDATGRNYEVSKKWHRQDNSRAVRWGPISIGPPQRGQFQTATSIDVAPLSGDGMKSKSLRAKASRVVRQGLARYPNCRTRTNPRGSTCCRNRRRNSAAARVMVRSWLPWA